MGLPMRAIYTDVVAVSRAMPDRVHTVCLSCVNHHARQENRDYNAGAPYQTYTPAAGHANDENKDLQGNDRRGGLVLSGR